MSNDMAQELTTIRPLHILVVDDEVVSQAYVRSLIDWDEYSFHLFPPAYNGREARQFLTQHRVDIVILDMFMPGENGVELSSHIASEYPDISMLALSSHDDYDYVREAMRNGAYDYILKSRLDEDVLLHALLNIKQQILAHSNSHDMDTTRAYRWLFANGDYPFDSSLSTCGATVSRLPGLNGRPDLVRRQMAESLVTMIGQSLGIQDDIVFLYREPDIFVTIFLFESGSYNQILNDIYLEMRKIKDLVWQAYQMELLQSDYPIIAGRSNLPHSVAIAIDNMQSDQVPKHRSPTSGLSIREKRRFIDALEARNLSDSVDLIRRALQISGDENKNTLAILNELLDVIIGLAVEEQVELNVHSAQELNWAQSEDTEAIITRLTEIIERLFAKLSREQMRSPYIRQAIALIEEFYQDELSQEGVAIKLGLSASYFSRLFKQETGFTFIETLNQYRINKAKEMLHERRSIKETFLACGFKRYNYFATVFKQYCAMTPSEYVKHMTK